MLSCLAVAAPGFMLAPWLLHVLGQGASWLLFLYFDGFRPQKDYDGIAKCTFYDYNFFRTSGEAILGTVKYASEGI